MKECYVQKAFRDDSMAVVAAAGTLMSEYASQGYDLTLRQLYYQFVARTWIENTERSYKRLGTIISNARLAGLLDWDIMVDRTREARSVTHWSSPAEIIQECAKQYRLDTRQTQDTYIEVWVEKEALAGIVDRVCDCEDVGYLVCRGYVSQSAMWQAAKRFSQHQHQDAYLLYCGDHDPSGLDMVRDIDMRLNDVFGEYVSVVHVALSRDQVAEYHCPPNPAKTTDSRYADYRKVHGNKSWELDALDPRTLTGLITEAIAARTDPDKREVQLRKQRKHRATLIGLANRTD